MNSWSEVFPPPVLPNHLLNPKNVQLGMKDILFDWKGGYSGYARHPDTADSPFLPIPLDIFKQLTPAQKKEAQRHFVSRLKAACTKLNQAKVTAKELEEFFGNKLLHREGSYSFDDISAYKHRLQQGAFKLFLRAGDYGKEGSTLKEMSWPEQSADFAFYRDWVRTWYRSSSPKEGQPEPLVAKETIQQLHLQLCSTPDPANEAICKLLQRLKESKSTLVPLPDKNTLRNWILNTYDVKNPKEDENSHLKLYLYYLLDQKNLEVKETDLDPALGVCEDPIAKIKKLVKQELESRDALKGSADQSSALHWAASQAIVSNHIKTILANCDLSPTERANLYRLPPAMISFLGSFGKQLNCSWVKSEKLSAEQLEENYSPFGRVAFPSNMLQGLGWALNKKVNADTVSDPAQRAKLLKEIEEELQGIIKDPAFQSDNAHLDAKKAKFWLLHLARKALSGVQDDMRNFLRSWPGENSTYVHTQADTPFELIADKQFHLLTPAHKKESQRHFVQLLKTACEKLQNPNLTEKDLEEFFNTSANKKRVQQMTFYGFWKATELDWPDKSTEFAFLQDWTKNWYFSSTRKPGQEEFHTANNTARQLYSKLCGSSDSAHSAVCGALGHLVNGSVSRISPKEKFLLRNWILNTYGANDKEDDRNLKLYLYYLLDQNSHERHGFGVTPSLDICSDPIGKIKSLIKKEQESLSSLKKAPAHLDQIGKILLQCNLGFEERINLYKLPPAFIDVFASLEDELECSWISDHLPNAPFQDPSRMKIQFSPKTVELLGKALGKDLSDPAQQKKTITEIQDELQSLIANPSFKKNDSHLGIDRARYLALQLAKKSLAAAPTLKKKQSSPFEDVHKHFSGLSGNSPTADQKRQTIERNIAALKTVCAKLSASKSDLSEKKRLWEETLVEFLEKSDGEGPEYSEQAQILTYLDFAKAQLVGLGVRPRGPDYQKLARMVLHDLQKQREDQEVSPDILAEFEKLSDPSSQEINRETKVLVSNWLLKNIQDGKPSPQNEARKAMLFLLNPSTTSEPDFKACLHFSDLSHAYYSNQKKTLPTDKEKVQLVDEILAECPKADLQSLSSQLQQKPNAFLKVMFFALSSTVPDGAISEKTCHEYVSLSLPQLLEKVAFGESVHRLMDPVYVRNLLRLTNPLLRTSPLPLTGKFASPTDWWRVEIELERELTALKALAGPSPKEHAEKIQTLEFARKLLHLPNVLPKELQHLALKFTSQQRSINGEGKIDVEAVPPGFFSGDRKIVLRSTQDLKLHFLDLMNALQLIGHSFPVPMKDIQLPATLPENFDDREIQYSLYVINGLKNLLNGKLDPKETNELLQKQDFKGFAGAFKQSGQWPVGMKEKLLARLVVLETQLSKVRDLKSQSGPFPIGLDKNTWTSYASPRHSRDAKLIGDDLRKDAEVTQSLLEAIHNPNFRTFKDLCENGTNGPELCNLVKYALTLKYRHGKEHEDRAELYDKKLASEDVITEEDRKRIEGIILNYHLERGNEARKAHTTASLLGSVPSHLFALGKPDNFTKRQSVLSAYLDSVALKKPIHQDPFWLKLVQLLEEDSANSSSSFGMKRILSSLFSGPSKVEGQAVLKGLEDALSGKATNLSLEQVAILEEFRRWSASPTSVGSENHEDIQMAKQIVQQKLRGLSSSHGVPSSLFGYQEGEKHQAVQEQNRIRDEAKKLFHQMTGRTDYLPKKAERSAEEIPGILSAIYSKLSLLQAASKDDVACREVYLHAHSLLDKYKDYSPALLLLLERMLHEAFEDRLRVGCGDWFTMAVTLSTLEPEAFDKLRPLGLLHELNDADRAILIKQSYEDLLKLIPKDRTPFDFISQKINVTIPSTPPVQILVDMTNLSEARKRLAAINPDMILASQKELVDKLAKARMLIVLIEFLEQPKKERGEKLKFESEIKLGLSAPEKTKQIVEDKNKANFAKPLPNTFLNTLRDLTSLHAMGENRRDGYFTVVADSKLVSKEDRLALLHSPVWTAVAKDKDDSEKPVVSSTKTLFPQIKPINRDEEGTKEVLTLLGDLAQHSPSQYQGIVRDIENSSRRSVGFMGQIVHAVKDSEDNHIELEIRKQHALNVTYKYLEETEFPSPFVSKIDTAEKAKKNWEAAKRYNLELAKEMKGRILDEKHPITYKDAVRLFSKPHFFDLEHFGEPLEDLWARLRTGERIFNFMDKPLEMKDKKLIAQALRQDMLRFEIELKEGHNILEKPSFARILPSNLDEMEPEDARKAIRAGATSIASERALTFMQHLSNGLSELPEPVRKLADEYLKERLSQTDDMDDFYQQLYQAEHGSQDGSGSPVSSKGKPRRNPSATSASNSLVPQLQTVVANRYRERNLLKTQRFKERCGMDDPPPPKVELAVMRDVQLVFKKLEFEEQDTSSIRLNKAGAILRKGIFKIPDDDPVNLKVAFEIPEGWDLNRSDLAMALANERKENSQRRWPNGTKVVAPYDLPNSKANTELDRFDLARKLIFDISYDGDPIPHDQTGYSNEANLFFRDFKKGVGMWFGRVLAGGNAERPLAEILARLDQKIPNTNPDKPHMLADAALFVVRLVNDPNLKIESRVLEFKNRVNQEARALFDYYPTDKTFVSQSLGSSRAIEMKFPQTDVVILNRRFGENVSVSELLRQKEKESAEEIENWLKSPRAMKIAGLDINGKPREFELKDKLQQMRWLTSALPANHPARLAFLKYSFPPEIRHLFEPIPYDSEKGDFQKEVALFPHQLCEEMWGRFNQERAPGDPAQTISEGDNQKELENFLSHVQKVDDLSEFRSSYKKLKALDVASLPKPERIAAIKRSIQSTLGHLPTEDFKKCVHWMWSNSNLDAAAALRSINSQKAKVITRAFAASEKGNLPKEAQEKKPTGISTQFILDHWIDQMVSAESPYRQAPISEGPEIAKEMQNERIKKSEMEFLRKEDLVQERFRLLNEYEEALLRRKTPDHAPIPGSRMISYRGGDPTVPPEDEIPRILANLSYFMFERNKNAMKAFIRSKNYETPEEGKTAQAIDEMYFAKYREHLKKYLSHMSPKTVEHIAKLMISRNLVDPAQAVLHYEGILQKALTHVDDAISQGKGGVGPGLFEASYHSPVPQSADKRSEDCAHTYEKEMENNSTQNLSLYHYFLNYCSPASAFSMDEDGLRRGKIPSDDPRQFSDKYLFENGSQNWDVGISGKSRLGLAKLPPFAHRMLEFLIRRNTTNSSEYGGGPGRCFLFEKNNPSFKGKIPLANEAELSKEEIARLILNPTVPAIMDAIWRNENLRSDYLEWISPSMRPRAPAEIKYAGGRELISRANKEFCNDEGASVLIKPICWKLGTDESKVHRLMVQLGEGLKQEVEHQRREIEEKYKKGQLTDQDLDEFKEFYYSDHNPHAFVNFKVDAMLRAFVKGHYRAAVDNGMGEKEKAALWRDWESSRAELSQLIRNSNSFAHLISSQFQDQKAVAFRYVDSIRQASRYKKLEEWRANAIPASDTEDVDLDTFRRGLKHIYSASDDDLKLFRQLSWEHFKGRIGKVESGPQKLADPKAAPQIVFKGSPPALEDPREDLLFIAPILRQNIYKTHASLFDCEGSNPAKKLHGELYKEFGPQKPATVKASGDPRKAAASAKLSGSGFVRTRRTFSTVAARALARDPDVLPDKVAVQNPVPNGQRVPQPDLAPDKEKARKEALEKAAAHYRDLLGGSKTWSFDLLPDRDRVREALFHEIYRNDNKSVKQRDLPPDWWEKVFSEKAFASFRDYFGKLVPDKAKNLPAISSDLDAILKRIAVHGDALDIHFTNGWYQRYGLTTSQADAFQSYALLISVAAKDLKGYARDLLRRGLPAGWEKPFEKLPPEVTKELVLTLLAKSSFPDPGRRKKIEKSDWLKIFKQGVPETWRKEYVGVNPDGMRKLDKFQASLGPERSKELERQLLSAVFHPGNMEQVLRPGWNTVFGLPKEEMEAAEKLVVYLKDKFESISRHGTSMLHQLSNYPSMVSAVVGNDWKEKFMALPADDIEHIRHLEDLLLNQLPALGVRGTVEAFHYLLLDPTHENITHLLRQYDSEYSRYFMSEQKIAELRQKLNTQMKKAIDEYSKKKAPAGSFAYTMNPEAWKDFEALSKLSFVKSYLLELQQQQEGNDPAENEKRIRDRLGKLFGTNLLSGPPLQQMYMAYRSEYLRNAGKPALQKELAAREPFLVHMIEEEKRLRSAVLNDYLKDSPLKGNPEDYTRFLFSQKKEDLPKSYFPEGKNAEELLKHYQTAAHITLEMLDLPNDPSVYFKENSHSAKPTGDKTKFNTADSHTQYAQKEVERALFSREWENKACGTEDTLNFAKQAYRIWRAENDREEKQIKMYQDKFQACVKAYKEKRKAEERPLVIAHADHYANYRQTEKDIHDLEKFIADAEKVQLFLNPKEKLQGQFPDSPAQKAALEKPEGDDKVQDRGRNKELIDRWKNDLKNKINARSTDQSDYDKAVKAFADKSLEWEAKRETEEQKCRDLATEGVGIREKDPRAPTTQNIVEKLLEARKVRDEKNTVGQLPKDYGIQQKALQEYALKYLDLMNRGQGLGMQLAKDLVNDPTYDHDPLRRISFDFRQTMEKRQKDNPQFSQYLEDAKTLCVGATDVGRLPFQVAWENYDKHKLASDELRQIVTLMKKEFGVTFNGKEFNLFEGDFSKAPNSTEHVPKGVKVQSYTPPRIARGIKGDALTLDTLMHDLKDVLGRYGSLYARKGEPLVDMVGDWGALNPVDQWEGLKDAAYLTWRQMGKPKWMPLNGSTAVAIHEKDGKVYYEFDSLTHKQEQARTLLAQINYEIGHNTKLYTDLRDHQDQFALQRAIDEMNDADKTRDGSGNIAKERWEDHKANLMGVKNDSSRKGYIAELEELGVITPGDDNPTSSRDLAKHFRLENTEKLLLDDDYLKDAMYRDGVARDFELMKIAAEVAAAVVLPGVGRIPGLLGYNPLARYIEVTENLASLTLRQRALVAGARYAQGYLRGVRFHYLVMGIPQAVQKGMDLAKPYDERDPEGRLKVGQNANESSTASIMFGLGEMFTPAFRRAGLLIGAGPKATGFSAMYASAFLAHVQHDVVDKGKSLSDAIKDNLLSNVTMGLYGANTGGVLGLIAIDTADEVFQYYYGSNSDQMQQMAREKGLNPWEGFVDNYSNRIKRNAFMYLEHMYNHRSGADVPTSRARTMMETGKDPGDPAKLIREPVRYLTSNLKYIGEKLFRPKSTFDHTDPAEQVNIRNNLRAGGRKFAEELVQSMDKSEVVRPGKPMSSLTPAERDAEIAYFDSDYVINRVVRGMDYLEFREYLDHSDGFAEYVAEALTTRTGYRVTPRKLRLGVAQYMRLYRPDLNNRFVGERPFKNRPLDLNRENRPMAELLDEMMANMYGISLDLPRDVMRQKAGLGGP